MVYVLRLRLLWKVDILVHFLYSSISFRTVRFSWHVLLITEYFLFWGEINLFGDPYDVHGNMKFSARMKGSYQFSDPCWNIRFGNQANNSAYTR